MALENKAQKTKREALEALPRIVQATQTSEVGYTFCTAEIVEWLFKNGFAEGNPEIVNEAGAIATRATQKGVEKVMSETTVETPATTEKPAFVIEDGIPIPKSTRGGNRESSYPFAQLNVGQSFFIPASEKHPEPAKSLASTISGATKRYDVPDMEEDGVTQKQKKVRVPKTGEEKIVPAFKHTRVFQIKAVEGGARCWRIA